MCERVGAKEMDDCCVNELMKECVKEQESWCERNGGEGVKEIRLKEKNGENMQSIN